jgi:hypothetical protein
MFDYRLIMRIDLNCCRGKQHIYKMQRYAQQAARIIEKRNEKAGLQSKTSTTTATTREEQQSKQGIARGTNSAGIDGRTTQQNRQLGSSSNRSGLDAP